MKIKDREAIGRTKFLKLEKKLIETYPAVTTKTLFNVRQLANDMKMPYATVHANIRQRGMMSLEFFKKASELF
jgi:hypothetical protein